MEEPHVTNTLLVPLLSASLLAVSIVWLFYGWRLYWLFITLLTAIVSAFFGWYFVSPHLEIDVRYLPPLLLGLAGGAMAIPLQRVAAFVLDGALGAIIAVAVGVGFCNVPLEFSSPQIAAIAAAGFLTAGVPAAIFFNVLKTVSTAGYGAFLAIVGCAAIAFAFAEEPPVVGASLVVACLGIWVALTTVGVVFQWRSQIIHKAQTSG